MGSKGVKKSSSWVNSAFYFRKFSSLFSRGLCFTSDPLPPGSPSPRRCSSSLLISQCPEIAFCLDRGLEVKTTQSGLSYLIIWFSRHFVSLSTTFCTIFHQLLETVPSWLVQYLPPRGSQVPPGIRLSIPPLCAGRLKSSVLGLLLLFLLLLKEQLLRI